MIFSIEDYLAEGGLGKAVASAVGGLAPVHILAVTEHPRSGSGAELRARHGIDRAAIVARVLESARERGIERRA